MTKLDDSRWTHLVTLAFHLNEAPSELKKERVKTVLASALEVFRQVDPSEDFEDYAVRRFIKALEDALES